MILNNWFGTDVFVVLVLRIIMHALESVMLLQVHSFCLLSSCPGNCYTLDKLSFNRITLAVFFFFMGELVCCQLGCNTVHGNDTTTACGNSNYCYRMWLPACEARPNLHPDSKIDTPCRIEEQPEYVTV